MLAFHAAISLLLVENKVRVLLSVTPQMCVCVCLQEFYFILYLAVRGNQTHCFFLPSKAVQPATVIPKDFKLR